MPLQKAYRGLANLAGLFEAGQLKLDIGRLVQPTIDVIRFAEPPRYLFDNTIAITGTVGTVYNFQQVPANEQWLVYLMGIVSVGPVPAGNTVQMSPRLTINQGSSACGLWNEGGAGFHATSAGTILSEGIVFPEPLMVLPGNQLGWQCVARTGANNIPSSIVMQYSRIQI